jgi:hypothetical protein
LSINAGALKYNKDIYYEFSISTQCFGETFSHVLAIKIDPSTTVPIPNLKLVKELD